MLRVGLTGGLGSGKSTAAELFRSLGAHVINADTLGREMMQPGEDVFAAIAEHFGPEVVLADGTLDRSRLAQIAFGDGRVEELNAIVHPAVIARQSQMIDAIAAGEPWAVVIVESALIFETKHSETRYSEIRRSETTDGDPGLSGESWNKRFDRIILVAANEELKVARFVARASGGRTLSEDERRGLEDEAYRRLARQIPDNQKTAQCDYVLTNNGSVRELEWQVDQLWPILEAAAR